MVKLCSLKLKTIKGHKSDPNASVYLPKKIGLLGFTKIGNANMR